MDRLFPFGDACSSQCKTWSSATCTVRIANTPPIANDDAFDNMHTGECVTSITGNVLDNSDRDLDGDELFATLTTAPAFGDLDFNEDGSFTFHFTDSDLDPNLMEAPTAVFTYVASDGIDTSNEATVTITLCSTIESPPILSVLNEGECDCPSGDSSCVACHRFRVAVYDPDFDIFWGDEQVALGASFKGSQSGQLIWSGFGLDNEEKQRQGLSGRDSVWFPDCSAGQRSSQLRGSYRGVRYIWAV
jgi:VCBS repeat-containing protein